jgi:chromosome segregation ATPase
MTMSNRNEVIKEVRRLVHQYRHLTEFLESLEELNALETEAAETKTRLERLKVEEAETRARIDAATKEATDIVAAAKRKSDELIAAASRRADEKTAAAESAAARLARDSDELSSVGAQLAAMRSEIEGLKAKFNN